MDQVQLPTARRHPRHLAALSSLDDASHRLRSSAPGEALSLKELGRQFVRRRQGFSSWQMADLGGKYVLVIPYDLDFKTLRHQAI